MAKDYAVGFYNSKHWERCRRAYIAHRKAVDGGLCEKCGEKPGYIVHHKRHITPGTINDPDVLLGFDNLQYVCLDCHNSIHYKREEREIEGMARYTFTADGRTVLEDS